MMFGDLGDDKRKDQRALIGRKEFSGVFARLMIPSYVCLILERKD